METAERYWSGPYWDGVDAARLHALPLAAVKPSSLPSPLLRRIVSYTISHLRAQHPHAAPPSYHLSVLNCTVRLPSLPSSPAHRPLPLTVCRLWPAVLFEGMRRCGEEEGAAGLTAAAAASAGCDLWFGREIGCFIRTAPIHETEAITLQLVAVDLEQGDDEDGEDDEADTETDITRPP